MITRKDREVTYSDLMEEFERQYPGQACKFKPHWELPLAMYVWLKNGDMLIVQYNFQFQAFIKIGEKLVLPEGDGCGAKMDGEHVL